MDLVATNMAACLGKMLYRSLGTGMIRLHCRMMTKPVLLWLRQDLRLSDQAALVAAVQAGPVIPLYILDDDTPRHWAMGGASRWWLHHSLLRLDESSLPGVNRFQLESGMRICAGTECLTDEEMEFECDLPEDMKSLISILNQIDR